MMHIVKFIAFVFTLAVFLWLAGLASFLVSISAMKPINSHAKTDAIIVLTGGNYRIQTGLNLWSQNLAPDLYITGVNKNNNRRKIMRGWKGERPLPHCCLSIGFEATTTRENAAETQEWVKDNYARSARLVTSTYHMPRAELEFRNAMPDLKIIPHPVEKTDYKINEWRFWKIAFLEFNKTIARRIEILSGQDWF